MKFSYDDISHNYITYEPLQWWRVILWFSSLC